MKRSVPSVFYRDIVIINNSNSNGVNNKGRPAATTYVWRMELTILLAGRDGNIMGTGKTTCSLAQHL